MSSAEHPGRVVVLGINGHLGHHIAATFAAAGWTVSGFGRRNKRPIAGVRFVAGDAENLDDLRRAVADEDVIVNALNLPYDKWDKGRKEALMARVVAAIGPKSGKTMMFPANIYNYAASQRVVTPDAPELPQTPRGEIRKRLEANLRAAAERGDLQLIMVRAGDFYGPRSTGDWFDQAILREAGKGRFAVPGKPGEGHSWAYLPDLARAFEVLARRRHDLRQSELFHFAGHYLSREQLAQAVKAAAPVPLVQTPFPWGMFGLLGLAMPVMREILKMRYLWDNSLELRDSRLDALLGPGFSTPVEEAMRETVTPFFVEQRKAA